MGALSKRDLRHQHVQQKRKHEKRLAQREAAKSVTVRPQVITSAQAGRLAQYFVSVDYEQMPWWRIKEALAKKLEVEGTTPQISYASQSEALAALLDIGLSICEQVAQAGARSHENDPEEVLWAKRMVNEGVLKDRAAAVVKLVEHCPPVHAFKAGLLVDNVQATNRTEKDIGISGMRELFASKYIIPPDYELQVLRLPDKKAEKKQEFTYSKVAQQTFLHRDKASGQYGIRHLAELGYDSPAARLLVVLTTEHLLSDSANTYMNELDERVADPVEHTRRVIFESCVQMAKKPTLRETSTRIALRYLGDSSSAINFKINRALGTFLLENPKLKAFVCSRIEETIWMQKLDTFTISRRNAGKRALDSTAERIAKRARSAKFEMKKIIKSVHAEAAEPTEHTSITVGEQRAHNYVTNATKFLADVAYEKADLENGFIHDNLKRFLRILRRFMTKSDAPKLLAIQNKQIKLLKRHKRQLKSAADDSEKSTLVQKSAEAATDLMSGDLLSYATGLGLCERGSHVLQFLISGIRRVLPYCTDEVVRSMVLVDSTTKEKKSTFEVVGAELLKLAHNAPCLVTRVHAWVLTYLLLKKISRESDVYKNLYAQLKDARLMHTRARASWVRLVLSVIRDPKCDAVARCSYLRRLVNLSNITDAETLVLPILVAMDEILNDDETAFREWVDESAGDAIASGTIVPGEPYCDSECNPGKTNALTSDFWELSLSACSIFPSVSTVCRTFIERRALAVECTPADSLLESVGWNELATSTEVSGGFLNRCQSLNALYKLLLGQSLRKAFHEKDKKDEEEDADSDVEMANDEDGDTDDTKHVADLGIRSKAFWQKVDESGLQFPFRRVLESTLKPLARSASKSSLSFEDEVDRMADAFVYGGQLPDDYTDGVSEAGETPPADDLSSDDDEASSVGSDFAPAVNDDFE